MNNEQRFCLEQVMHTVNFMYFIIFFGQKMPAFYICCFYSDGLQTSFDLYGSKHYELWSDCLLKANRLLNLKIIFSTNCKQFILRNIPFLIFLVWETFLKIKSAIINICIKFLNCQWMRMAVFDLQKVSEKWLKGNPGNAWVKVLRIIPEFRILRLTFHRKSASKCWIREIIIAFLIYFQSV